LIAEIFPLAEVEPMTRSTLAAGCLLVAMLVPTGCQSAGRHVLTAEEQAALTPDEVVTLMQEGNERFLAGRESVTDHRQQVHLAATGQHPMAIVLSCVDSRVPVEDVFDMSIGDIYVARVAGSFENTDILGSMEYATRVTGGKLVVVMGHGSCGAVKSAIDGVELGNITSMLSNIAPAIPMVSYDGDRGSGNHEFVDLVTKQNVRLTIEDIRTRSPVMADMERRGELKIVGAFYDIHTGRVDFFD
jgi:carbonic anhydrase